MKKRISREFLAFIILANLTIMSEAQKRPRELGILIGVMNPGASNSRLSITLTQSLTLFPYFFVKRRLNFGTEARQWGQRQPWDLFQREGKGEREQLEEVFEKVFEKE